MQRHPSYPLDAELSALAQDARRRAAERNAADALTRARVDLMIARSYVEGARSVGCRKAAFVLLNCAADKRRRAQVVLGGISKA